MADSESSFLDSGQSDDMVGEDREKCEKLINTLVDAAGKPQVVLEAGKVGEKPAKPMAAAAGTKAQVDQVVEEAESRLDDDVAEFIAEDLAAEETQRQVLAAEEVDPGVEEAESRLDLDLAEFGGENLMAADGVDQLLAVGRAPASKQRVHKRCSTKVKRQIPVGGTVSNAGDPPPCPGNGSGAGAGHLPPSSETAPRAEPTAAGSAIPAPPVSAHPSPPLGNQGHLPSPSETARPGNPSPTPLGIAKGNQGHSKFDADLATSLFNQKEWNKLEDYVVSFVSENSHNGVSNEHPALMFIIFEQMAIQLLREQKFDDATSLFDSKVKPLLSTTDKMFTPLDLSDHIAALEKLLEARVRPKDEDNPSYSKNPLLALLDYISLYYPKCIRSPTETWENSIQEFMAVYMEGTTVQYRCLACQWVVPPGQSLSSMVAHVKHTVGKQHSKQCRSFSLNLLSRLDLLEGRQQEVLNFEAFQAKYRLWTRKRKESSSDQSPAKTPQFDKRAKQNIHLSQVSGLPQSVEVKQDNAAVGRILSIIQELRQNNTAIVECYPPENNSKIAVTVRDVCTKQRKLINGIEKRYYKGEGMDFDDLFNVAVVLHANSGNLLRPDVLSKISNLDATICKLRVTCYVRPPSASSTDPSLNTSAGDSNI